MTWLRDKIACDDLECSEVFRGPTFPSQLAGETWHRAYEAGWRDVRAREAPTPTHLCAECFLKRFPDMAAREAVEREKARPYREELVQERARCLAEVQILHAGDAFRVTFPQAPAQKVVDLLRKHNFQFRDGGWTVRWNQERESVAGLAAQWFSETRRRR